MTPPSTKNDTGESRLRAMIAKHNITLTTQYLGSNAIDVNENQWLATFRRGDGRTWTTRFYGTDEDLRVSLRAAESAAVPMPIGIFEQMFAESQYEIPDFDEFFVEYYSEPSSVPTAWDRMFHKYILAQADGLDRFLEGLDFPTE